MLSPLFANYEGFLFLFFIFYVNSFSFKKMSVLFQTKFLDLSLVVRSCWEIFSIISEWAQKSILSHI
jgi:hypothetical protein